MERKILGVSWRDRKTNSWVRTQTGCKDLTQTVKSSKWNWAGHLTRRTDDRWTTKSTILPEMETSVIAIAKILFTILALFGLTFSSYQLIVEFLFSNIVINTNILAEPNVNFPAVTICNLNAFVCSKVQKDGELSELLGGGPCFNDSVSIDREVEARAITWDSYHRRLEFLDSDFLQTLDQDYGNCYTFNSAWVYQDSKFVFRKDRIKKVRSPGPMSGLEIIFNINQEEYIPGLSHEAGLRIVFHDSKELPHSVLEQGINIPPGMNSVIQLRKSEFIRLANYKDKCATKYTQDLLKAFPISIKDSEMYNTGKCVGLMWQLCVIDTCKCRDVNSLGNIDYPDLPGCNVELNSKYAAVMKVHVLIFQWNHIANEVLICKQECRKANFDITPTSTIWPADAFADRVMRKYSNREKSASNFRKSFGKFGLHLSSLLKSQVIESKRFTIDTLLSNFGGLVGMYIGISVLSIFDLIKYVMFKSDKKKEEHKRSKSITPLTSQKKRNSFSTQRKVIFTKGMDRTLEIQCKANFIFSIQCHNIIQVQ
ncbi:Acid-sensing ion channel 4-A [Nymphon striatum]|nr:Acid-sensing ion channel 4-A [Nymphon striatum]